MNIMPCKKCRRSKEAVRMEVGEAEYFANHMPKRTAKAKIRGPALLSEEPGHKPGNDLLSRDLSSYYHWLLGA